MPAAPSADGLRRAFRVRSVLRATAFSSAQKVLLLGLNAWPLVHVLGAVASATLLPWSPTMRALVTLTWLLLVPPILCRLALVGVRPTGEFPVPSLIFFRWWTTWQLQAPFNRLPWIEETLRFVPGLYSAWLRLWGARIGRLTLWSPGTKIFDRPFVQLGDDVVVGIDVRFVAHFSGVNPEGQTTLSLGPITLGDRTSIGGSALLSAGFILDPDQATEALFLGAPFTRWRGAQRVSVDSTHHARSPANP